MYATESDFTHGLSRTVAGEAANARSGGRPIAVLPAMSPDELAALSVDHIRAAIGDDPAWRGRGVALVLAAHGTLLEPTRPVETGLVATQRLCDAIRARLNGDFGLVVNGWLNHTKGGRWTEPPIDAALRHVRDAGFARAVYFPYGFLADNAESELEGRMALASAPQLEHRHLPCLNDSAALIGLLAHQVLQH
jgi:protoheme ferro-lyase